MEDEVPGLQVEFDDTTGMPSRIATTAPDGELAPPEETPRRPSADSTSFRDLVERFQDPDDLPGS